MHQYFLQFYGSGVDFYHVLPASTGVLHSLFSTEARVMFCKCKLNHLTLLLKILQRLPILLREKKLNSFPWSLRPFSDQDSTLPTSQHQLPIFHLLTLYQFCASYTGFLLLLETSGLHFFQFLPQGLCAWWSHCLRLFFHRTFWFLLIFQGLSYHPLREATLDNPVSSIFPPTPSHLLSFHYPVFFIAFTTIWNCSVLFTCLLSTSPWKSVNSMKAETLTDLVSAISQASRMEPRRCSINIWRNAWLSCLELLNLPDLALLSAPKTGSLY